MTDPDFLVLGVPSVAAGGGRILAVGTREEVLALGGPATRIEDRGTARILPGFRDAHCHVVPTGLALGRLDLHGLDLDGVRQAVGKRAAGTPPGVPIEGRGFSLAGLGTGRDPRASDLDDVAPEHPVRLASHDLHGLWVNTAALRAAGRDPDSPSYLTEDEVRRFNAAMGREGPEALLAAARSGQAALVEGGIREVQDHSRFAEFQALHRLAMAGELEIEIFFSIRHHELARYLAERDRYPDVPGRLVVNGVKLFLDGALGSRTAWTLEPWSDAGGYGHRTHTHESARASVRAAAEAGLPTFFHAIGDAAVREALDLAGEFPGLPHRVEHAQLIHPNDLGRFARQGVAASVQPCHLLTDVPILLPSWGEERARRSFPIRSLLEHGADVLFGTDTPVEPFAPMPGIFAASERRTRAGERLPGEEAISRERAVELALGPGRLAIGAPAFFTVWAEDPCRVPPDDLPDLTPDVVFAA